MWSPRESLKLNWVTKFMRQNRTASKKSVHLSNSDIFDILSISGRCMFNMTVQWLLIACQSLLFLTVTLECLSHLASALQYLYCHWILYRSTWTKFRGHSLALATCCSVVQQAVAGSLKMWNYIFHDISPFWTIFLYMTYHFSIDKYKSKLNV